MTCINYFVPDRADYGRMKLQTDPKVLAQAPLLWSSGNQVRFLNLSFARGGMYIVIPIWTRYSQPLRKEGRRHMWPYLHWPKALDCHST